MEDDEDLQALLESPPDMGGMASLTGHLPGMSGDPEPAAEKVRQPAETPEAEVAQAAPTPAMAAAVPTPQTTPISAPNIIGTAAAAAALPATGTSLPVPEVAAASEQAAALQILNMVGPQAAATAGSGMSAPPAASSPASAAGGAAAAVPAAAPGMAASQKTVETVGLPNQLQQPPAASGQPAPAQQLPPGSQVAAAAKSAADPKDERAEPLPQVQQQIPPGSSSDLGAADQAAHLLLQLQQEKPPSSNPQGSRSDYAAHLLMQLQQRQQPKFPAASTSNGGAASGPDVNEKRRPGRPPRVLRSFFAGLCYPSDRVHDILGKPKFLDTVAAQLQALGYRSTEAVTLLKEAWAAESTRLGDALRSYRAHVDGCQEPRYDVFLVGIFGLDAVRALRLPANQRPAVAAAPEKPAVESAAAAHDALDVPGSSTSSRDQLGQGEFGGYRLEPWQMRQKREPEAEGEEKESKRQKAAAEASVMVAAGAQGAMPSPIKRKVGRPRKSPLLGIGDTVNGSTQSEAAGVAPSAAAPPTGHAAIAAARVGTAGSAAAAAAGPAPSTAGPAGVGGLGSSGAIDMHMVVPLLLKLTNSVQGVFELMSGMHNVTLGLGANFHWTAEAVEYLRSTATAVAPFYGAAPSTGAAAAGGLPVPYAITTAPVTSIPGRLPITGEVPGETRPSSMPAAGTKRAAVVRNLPTAAGTLAAGVVRPLVTGGEVLAAPQQQQQQQAMPAADEQKPQAAQQAAQQQQQQQHGVNVLAAAQQQQPASQGGASLVNMLDLGGSNAVQEHK